MVTLFTINQWQIKAMPLLVNGKLQLSTIEWKPLQKIAKTDCGHKQVLVKAEASSKISSFVNHYLSGAKLVALGEKNWHVKKTRPSAENSALNLPRPSLHSPVADPGFPLRWGVNLVEGGVDSRGSYVLKIFLCQDERNWALRGDVRRARPS